MPAQAASADTRKLIGRNIQNAQNETIGEIKSVFIGKDGDAELRLRDQFAGGFQQFDDAG